MASDLEKIGLQALLLVDQFNQGMKEYLAGIQKMEAETDKAAGQTAKSTEQMAARQQAALREVGIAFAAVGAAGTALLGSIAMTASRTEELSVILDVTAENARRTAESEGDYARAAALTAEAVDEQVQAIRDLHLTQQVASKIVAQLIRYNLDWTKSTDLARLAQDAATFAAQDSSEALEGLIHGITTLNPRVLRTYGIIVNLEQSYSEFAKATGRTVESITMQEKQQIAFNQVLGQASAITGAYEAAMDSASKQIRSLRTDVTDVADEFGAHFTPFLNEAVGALRGFLAWLRDLPDPIQATATTTLALGSAFATLGGALLLVLPKIKAVKQALLELKAIQQLAAAGLLAPAGLIAGLLTAIGIFAIYRRNVEKAHQAEAAAILDASKSYNEYVEKLEKADIASLGLSESLYEIAKAADAAQRGVDALAMTQAWESIKANIEYLSQRRMIGEFAGDPAAEFATMVEALRDVIAILDEAGLAVAQDQEQMQALFETYGFGEKLARDLAEAMGDLAKEQSDYNLAVEASIENEGRRLAAYQRETTELTGVQKGFNRALAGTARLLDLVADKYKKLGILDLVKEYAERAGDALDQAAWDMVEADQEAVDAILEVREKFEDDKVELAEEHAENEKEILDDLAEVDADLAADRLQAQKDYQRDRAELAEEHAGDILDADRDLAEEREDLARDLTRKLEDLERDHVEDVEDLNRELARDLESMERDHLRDMLDMRRDYYQDLEDLARDYNKRRGDIEEAFAEDRADTEKDYTEASSDLFQEYLDKLMELTGETSPTWLANMLKAARPGQIYSPEFQDIIDAYLEELAKLRDERDEDLQEAGESRDKDLADLEEWLAEEQEERKRAYEEEQREAEEAYQRRRQDREAQYAQDQEDLQRNLEAQRQELERDHQQRLEDLQRQNERERAEMERRYQERLRALDRQLAEEQTRLEQRAEADRARLQAQLDEEDAHYDERLQKLVDAHGDELREIDTAWKDRLEEIKKDLALELYQIIDDLGRESQAFRDAYKIQLDELQFYLDERLRKWREHQDALEGELGVGSPSRWAIGIGRSIREGMEIGMGAPSLAVDLGGAMEKFKQTAEGIQIAPPQASLAAAASQVYQPPMMPLPMPAPNVTSTYSNSFDLTANYARGQSEASLRDAIMALSMMMSAAHRRRR